MLSAILTLGLFQGCCQPGVTTIDSPEGIISINHERTR
jgi:hypothetical protein